jgi:1-aminocyclopropane-1-carboxylate deaminase/D-cysteine desulfhydrase-like pyridoxal-dependent ACC family enzyme
MEANDYYKRIMELADLDVEAKTIAESRVILEELQAREEELKDLHLELKRDIRYMEAVYIKRKRELNQVFNQNQDLIPKKRFGKKKESRVTVLKKMEKEKQEVLDPYYEVRAMAEQLLNEMNEAKKPLQNFVIDKMGL